MKIFIALMVLLLSTVTHADVTGARITHQVNAFLGTHLGYEGTIYYRCHDAKRQVEGFLESLGATNIDVSCSGGLDSNGMSSLAHIRTHFDSFVMTPNGAELGRFVDVALRDHENCALTAELFHLFQSSFVIQELQGRGSRASGACRANQSFNVTLKVAN